MNQRADIHHSRESRRKEAKKPLNPLIGLLRGTGIGILSGTITGILILLISAWILLSTEDPDALIYPASLLSLGIASLICGIVSVRLSSAAYLPTVLSAAVVWLILTFLASPVIGSGAGALPNVYAIAFRIPQALLVLLGGFLGKNRPRSAKPRRRKR